MDTGAMGRFIAALRPAFAAGDAGAEGKEVEAACVAVVEAAYRAIAAGDATAFAALLDEDVEFETVGPPGVPLVGRWRGRAAALDGVRKNFACLEDQRPEVQTVVAQGDTVVVVGRERGRFRPTGRGYELHWVQVFTCRAGKVVRFQQVFDSGALIAAAAAGVQA